MMWLIMKCNDTQCKIKVDAIERVEDVIFAYRRPSGGITATEFAGCFSLGSVDYLYVTEERGNQSEA